MTMREPITFSGNPLDRVSARRKDPSWLDERIGAADSRFLVFSKLQVLADENGLLWLDASVRELLGDAEPWLLGMRDGAAHFAVDLSHLQDPLAALSLSSGRFAEARGLAAQVPGPDAAIVAHGRALVEWHRRHRYCGACGELTVVKEGGAMRKCEACGIEHFPRTDPAVIMAVWRGDRIVLGRQKVWPAGNYSTLAGFVDQGETIEEAVRREVLEEVGLEVDEVDYHASQPWPFPFNLMIGCFAHAASDDLKFDPDELDHARWFTREEVRRAVESPDPSLGFSIPGRIAIAHHLIRDWSELEGGHTH